MKLRRWKLREVKKGRQAVSAGGQRTDNDYHIATGCATHATCGDFILRERYENLH
jgi:hypothetical protein